MAKGNFGMLPTVCVGFQVVSTMPEFSVSQRCGKEEMDNLSEHCEA